MGTQENTGTESGVNETAVKDDAPSGAGVNQTGVNETAVNETAVNETEIKKERILILGGGVSALTAAFELTSQPGWDQNYEIAVYQPGWRLGGKCASGRSREAPHRIQEHGLHILLGFYENTFRMIRQCYQELVDRRLRAPGDPSSDWKKMFQGGSNVELCEYVDGEWIPWRFNPPPNEDTPGEPAAHPWSPWEMVREVIRWMLDHFNRSPHSQESGASGASRDVKIHPLLWSRLTERLGQEVLQAEMLAASKLLELAAHLVSSLSQNPGDHKADDHQDILWLLRKFMGWLWERLESELGKTDSRRLLISISLAYATVHGMLKDGVLSHGFAAIDHWDFREWIASHLQDLSLDPQQQKIVLDSAPVRGLYNTLFAFLNGDYWTPESEGSFSLEAGTGLYFGLVALLTYKGSLYYRMLGGTGDALLAPLYQVLASRGVKFHFFHRVLNLALSKETPNLVQKVTLGRQVTLKDPTQEYSPLVEVPYSFNGANYNLPSWPAEPKYEWINDEEAAELQSRKINLESFWTDWQDKQTVELKQGEQFDKIILGVSIGGLPSICPELIAASAPWQEMIKHVRTVKTMASQYWLKKTLQELGWEGLPPTMSSFVEPLNALAGRSDLLPFENWPEEAGAKDILILCGPMPGDPSQDPPATDHAFPSQQNQKIGKEALQWLTQHSAHLFPGGSPGGNFDWNILVDLKDGSGESRFESQYWKANINPSDQYVLSVPGSTSYRLRPSNSGFENLVLTGDWTLNHINAGCVEATVTSGMLASRAISGEPGQIFGEE